MLEMPSRRFFLRGLVAAPAVILTNHLMPIKPEPPFRWLSHDYFERRYGFRPNVYDPELIARQIVSVQPIDPRPWNDLMS